MIWMCAVPLKSNLTHNRVKTKMRGPEVDSFDAKMRNSNFNSDKRAEDALLNEKTEYLVNVNDHDNLHKDRTQILTDVFKK